MSKTLQAMQYAVRGDIVTKADSMLEEGHQITFTNIGNPHAVGQKPLTFFRQVLALCDLPAEYGVDHVAVNKMFPADAVDRARELRAAVGPAGTGAYTHSQGVESVRCDVADFISDRDGHAADHGNIFLTNGASSAIEAVMKTVLSDENDAVMIPIPQYPIYSALLTLLGAARVEYMLDESAGWSVSMPELERALSKAQADGLNVKALVMINPGNPTGQVMSRDTVESLAKFCANNNILLLADEVYQRNVYTPRKDFVSAKRVAVETAGLERLELISFHSTSKGIIGECGRRGGYMELHGIDPYVQAQLNKLLSSGLCSSVPGQLMTSLMVKPPKPGDLSYDAHTAEETAIFDTLKFNAEMLVDGLNSIEGVECQPAEGAMYAFPSLTLPPAAFDYAAANSTTPDTVYALSLLEQTGICVVPASGFGQAEGRVGFRTTFLPPTDQLKRAVGQFAEHHDAFVARFS